MHGWSSRLSLRSLRSWLNYPWLNLTRRMKGNLNHKVLFSFTVPLILVYTYGRKYFSCICFILTQIKPIFIVLVRTVLSKDLQHRVLSTSFTKSFLLQTNKYEIWSHLRMGNYPYPSLNKLIKSLYMDFNRENAIKNNHGS